MASLEVYDTIVPYLDSSAIQSHPKSRLSFSIVHIVYYIACTCYVILQSVREIDINIDRYRDLFRHDISKLGVLRENNTERGTP